MKRKRPDEPEVVDPSRLYHVLIVELEDEATRYPAMASIYPAGCNTDDMAEAVTWANAFNGRELMAPVDAWAVVRTNPEMRKAGAA